MSVKLREKLRKSDPELNLRIKTVILQAKIKLSCLFCELCPFF